MTREVLERQEVSFEMFWLIRIAFIEKEFGKGDNNGKDAATWKNREKDWYNAERRFIFAAKTRKERDMWLEKININSREKSKQKLIEEKIQQVKE